MERVNHTGRVPKASNWSSFYDAAFSLRPHGGDDATGRLRTVRYGVYPHGPDKISDKGGRAEQYNS